ncbi:MAG: hypothetical protein M1817_003404 [Caeruleum heppii]|nr:MAG: hypothetical protein M1817_003404 [Caeruleum heppii]
MASHDSPIVSSSEDASHQKTGPHPAGTSIPPKTHDEPIAAYEVPRTKRLFQVTTAVTYCLLAAGIVFGYAALKPIFISEGVYRDLCTDDELDRHVGTCYRQELRHVESPASSVTLADGSSVRLNLMFTVAAVSTNCCALPVGALLDRYGPRFTAMIGSLLFAVGCILLAFASRLPFDAYIGGYFFLALGGPFVFIPSFQLSNTFPAHSGLILSMLTGAFDASSAVFLIYRLLYSHTGDSLKPETFFLIYLIVPIFILLAQALLMPSKSYKTVGELVKQVEEEEPDEHDSDHETQNDEQLEVIRNERRLRRASVVSEITELLGPKAVDRQTKEEEKKQRVSGVWGALHGHSAYDQIRTPWFILITLFTIIQMTRINYFVATIRNQYAHLLGDYEKAVQINSFFDVALPVGGIIAIPFIGLALDGTSTPFVLALLVFVATTIGILGVLPYMWAGYANVCLFVLYRPFYYTAISDYSAKVFGFTNFGTVYGLIMCLGGIFNFSQAGLDTLTHRVFGNDPIPVNVFLLLLALAVGITLVGFVWARSRTLRRDLLEMEAERAPETLVPGGSA